MGHEAGVTFLLSFSPRQANQKQPYCVQITQSHKTFQQCVPHFLPDTRMDKMRSINYLIWRLEWVYSVWTDANWGLQTFPSFFKVHSLQVCWEIAWASSTAFLMPRPWCQSAGSTSVRFPSWLRRGEGWWCWNGATSVLPLEMRLCSWVGLMLHDPLLSLRPFNQRVHCSSSVEKQHG